MVPLARWGLNRLGTIEEGERFSLSWMLLYMQATADKQAALGVHDVYEFHTNGEVFHVTVDDGAVDARLGAAPRPPDVVLTADPDVLAALATGQLPAVEPATAGKPARR